MSEQRTMRAAVVREHGGLDAVQVEQVPVPTPGPDQVRLRVRAVGLNHLDCWVRRGVPGHPFPLPMILGCDFAGEVESVGEAVTNVAVGDAVCVAPGFSCGTCQACLSGNDHLCRSYGIYGETQDGGAAEFAVVNRANVLPKPDVLTFEEAASFPLAFLTAWGMLVERAAIQPGETVLILAAGSGVGSAGVQIAKLHGCTVIATASTDEKLERARELGADHTVNYAEEDFAKAVKRLTDRRGVDVVFEHTGQDTWAQSVRSLAWGGRLVTCGATSGFEARFDLRMLFFKSLSFLGSTMGSRGSLARIVEHMSTGRLRPVVDRVLPLDDVREAHRLMEERRQFGKLVLVP